jgi:DNA-binding MarR family transcriptional regulator
MTAHTPTNTAPARPATQPLTPEEEAAWRALARAMLVVPRILGAELLETHGLTMSEYSVLMNLSEAPQRSMRMSELADAVALSGSGLTRVVERLAHQGLVERIRCQTDARGQVAQLTDAGFARLTAAYPRHLEGVRRHVMDPLSSLDLVAFAKAMGQVAAGEAGPPVRRAHPRGASG